jgi:hypothetical protein
MFLLRVVGGVSYLLAVVCLSEDFGWIRLIILFDILPLLFCLTAKCIIKQLVNGRIHKPCEMLIAHINEQLRNISVEGYFGDLNGWRPISF